MAEQYGESKITFVLYMLLRLIIIAVIVMAIIRGDYEHIWQCVLALVMFRLPPFFERTIKADLPALFEIVILLFIFAFFILGEVFSFMALVPWWDTMLHTFYGFIFAAFSFSLIDVLNDDKNLKFKLSPFYLCLSSISITIFFGVLWEFFEYFADHFLGKDMQKDWLVTSFNSTYFDPGNGMTPYVVSDIKSTIINYANDQQIVLNGYLDIGIIDTMKDLFVAFIGALVFCIFLVAYLKTKGKNKFAAMLIPVKRNWNEEPPAPSDKLAKQIADLENQLVILRAQEKEKEIIEFREEKKVQKAERKSAKKEKKDNKKE
ncbi:MAG: hypothetical protein MJ115_06295 [Clostridia bacterium]|nr:hypothetical protein [Clostridia bacterium]